MPNDNALAGMRCPNCRSEGPFEVETICRGVWTDDGLEETTEPEFEDDAKMTCKSCKKTYTVAGFRLENQPALEIMTVEIAVWPGELDSLLDLLSDLRDDNPEVIVEWQRQTVENAGNAYRNNMHRERVFPRLVDKSELGHECPDWGFSKEQLEAIDRRSKEDRASLGMEGQQTHLTDAVKEMSDGK